MVEGDNLLVVTDAGPTDRAVQRAARGLAAAWGPGARVVSGRAGASGRTPTIAVRRGSCVRDTLCLELDVPLAADLSQATAMGASPLAWEGLDDWQAWRALAAPLPRALVGGALDPEHRWLLTSEATWRQQAVHRLPATVELLALGRHVVRGAHGVPRFIASPTAAAALLGKAQGVIGTGNEPLVHDAWRAGVRVLSPHELPEVLHDAAYAVAPPAAHPLLANAIAPALTGHAPLWREVVNRYRLARAGQAAFKPLMEDHWVQEARRRARRALARPPGRLGRARRRYLKLRRDPEAFFRDSRFTVLRHLGPWLTR